MNAITQIATPPLHRWRSRPADQGFASLEALLDHANHQRDISFAETASAGTLEAVVVDEDPNALLIRGAHEDAFVSPTNYAFGQLAGLNKAPAAYLARLPAPLAADCLNYGFKRVRNEDVGTLVRVNNSLERDDNVLVGELAAATGPRYGRIWNNDLIREFIDVNEGRFGVPSGGNDHGGQITGKDKCTVYGSEQDIFFFLIDEANPIEVGGEVLYRGLFGWNSEVGAASMGVGTFLLRGFCFNRTIFSPSQYGEVRIRHSSGAPGRYLSEVVPAIRSYANGSQKNIVDAVDAARNAKVGDNDEEVTEWLTKRYNKERAQSISLIHKNEENRPIRNLWDVNNALTAYARQKDHQDARVEIEREAGKVLALAQ